MVARRDRTWLTWYWFLICYEVFSRLIVHCTVEIELVVSSLILRIFWNVSWAGAHAVRSHTRSQRVAETRAEIEHELEASIRPLPPTPPEIPLEPPGGQRGQ